MPSEKNTSLIDANVILRYLLRDSEELYAEAEKVFNEVMEGKSKVLILESVVAEVVEDLQCKQEGNCRYSERVNRTQRC